MEIKPTVTPGHQNWNKPAYGIFVAAGLYFLVNRDFSQAVIFLGLALVFDPFNVNMPFHQRPVYQKAWLIVHLLVTLSLFIIMLMKN